MSTPPNKRDERRAARLANLANTQSARAALPTDESISEAPATPEVTESAPGIPTLDETPIIAQASAPEVPPVPTTPEVVVAAEVPSAKEDATATDGVKPSTSAPSPATKTPSKPIRAATAPAAARAAAMTSSSATKGVGKTTEAVRPTTGSVTRTPSTPVTPAKAAAAAAGSKASATRSANGASLSKASGAAAQPAASASSSARAAGGAVAKPTAPARAVEQARAAQAEAISEAQATKRDLRRETRRADLERIQASRRKALAQRKREEMIRRLVTLGIVALVVLVFGFFIYKAIQPAAPAHPVPSSGFGSGITCDSVSHDNEVHYHAQLTIVINGQKYTPPSQLGIDQAQGCLYWLHTHDDSGVIHIEAPASARTFELGDLLYVWKQVPGNGFPVGKPQLIDKNQFFGMALDSAHPLKIYINGTPFTGDPNTVPLKSLTNIWIEYGQPTITPTTYDFQGAGLGA